jgi:hypothetical protein
VTATSLSFASITDRRRIVPLAPREDTVRGLGHQTVCKEPNDDANQDRAPQRKQPFDPAPWGPKQPSGNQLTPRQPRTAFTRDGPSLPRRGLRGRKKVRSSSYHQVNRSPRGRRALPGPPARRHRAGRYSSRWMTCPDSWSAAGVFAWDPRAMVSCASRRIWNPWPCGPDGASTSAPGSPASTAKPGQTRMSRQEPGSL